MRSTDAVAVIRPGDMLFVRGGDTLHRLIGLVDGISHVAYAYRSGGRLLVRDMSRHGSESFPIHDWIRLWEYVLVVRPRCTVDESALYEEAALRWRYGPPMLDGYTYCTAHVSRMLRTVHSVDVRTDCGLLPSRPSSLRPHGETILDLGTAFDTALARRMDMTILTILSILILVVTRYTRSITWQVLRRILGDRLCAHTH